MPPLRRGDRWVALGLLCFAGIGCGATREQIPAEQWSVREVRRTPLTSAIAAEEIGDIEWATDSTLLVAIDRGRQLVLLNWDGTLWRRVSRRGSGPGETQMVGLLRRNHSRDSLIVSVDISQFRIAWWTPDGDLVRERPYDAAIATGVWMTDAGLVLRTIAAGAGEVRYNLLDDSARVIAQAAFDSRPRVPDISCGYCPSAVSADGIIAMATSDTSYRILRTRLDSVVLPVIERPESPIVALSAAEAASTAARWEDLAQRMVARGASDEIVTRLREMGGQSRFKKRFLGSGLEFDEAGSLWVQVTVADGDSAAVHVFGADARLMGEFRLPQGMVMRRVRDGVVLATAVLETGETVVVEYQTTESP